jgi:Tol biopolymer transport system component
MGRPSPDGRTFTYTDISGDLAVFDTGSGATRKITQKGQSTESAYLNSATSFDGTHVAYTWEAADGAKELRIIPVEGGSPRIILRVTDGYPHPLQWSVDGTRMLTMLERDDGPRTLAMLSVSDGRLTPIAEIDARHSSASLSPDGRYVVYDKGQEPNAFARDVYLAALDPPGATTALVTGPGDEFGPLWAPQGDRLLFVSDRSGEPSLWTVLVSDGVISGEPVMAHRNIGGVTPLGISTDGTLFYNLRIGLIDVYVASIDFDAGQVVDEPRSVAPARIGSNITSSWSPDGRRLAYVTLPPGGSSGGPRRLTVVDVDTGDTRVLSPSLGYYQGVRWSPDGRAILVKGWDLESRRGLFLVDPETGAPQQVAAVDKRTPKEIGSFHWHPLDPYQILFTRWDIGLRALDLRTGAERSVFTFAEEGITSIQAGIGFRPAPDGRAIAYVAFRHLGPGGRGETVLRVKEIGGGSRDVALGGWLQDWTRDGQHLLYWASSNDPDAPKVLSMIPAAGGTPRETGLKIRNLSDLSVHPDGRRVTFTAGLPASELWALENFLTARF